MILPNSEGGSVKNIPRLIGLAVVLLSGLVMPARFAARPAESLASNSAEDGVDLIQLSLEELGQIKITTVSRKGEALSGAAAAVHVVTQDEIRRSGALELPELLRMVPGLQVARANAHQWAVGTRGFSYIFANKMLVLLDGRNLYTPLFSGVFWEETHTVLEDIDRIEVIRGPGAALWGANAVNGVINILTKSARETQGLLISGGGGMENRGFGTVRYGGTLGSKAHYRVYGLGSDHDEFTRVETGEGAGDGWWISQGGFRVDAEPSELNQLTFQGDYYNGELDGLFRRHSLSPPGRFSRQILQTVEGANLLGRWTHPFSLESELSVQAYYDRTERGFEIAREERETFDLDTQHRFSAGERQEIVWGLGYRYSVDDIADGPDFKVRRSSIGLQLASAFVQDEIALLPDRLRLTLGTKLEHNDFTGFEFQPSGRLAWTPNARQTIWGAVSRAVRTPSRVERDASIFVDPPANSPLLPLPLLIPVDHNPHFRSEELIAFEIGHRLLPHPRLALDWTAFYHDYDHLRDTPTQPAQLLFSPANEPYLSVPIRIDNGLQGEAYGVEVAATWQPWDWWRCRASYSLMELKLQTSQSARTLSERDEGTDPEHQVKFWSDLDLGRRVEWGLGVRHVSDLSAVGVPGYTELDTRVAWKITPQCELAVVGRGLLAPHHREYAAHAIVDRNIAVDRMVYAKLTLRY